MSSSAAYSSRSIPQDAVHYTFYLPSSTSHSLPSATALASQITHTIEHELLPKEWIWHRDSFQLTTNDSVRERKEASVAGRTKAAAGEKQGSDGEEEDWVLRGVMRVGDSIEDEWVVVWLMKEITARFEGVVATIYDADGDFILIEAAQALPEWVTPSNSENRVWIANSHLHLIPLHISSPSSTLPPKSLRRQTNADSDDEDDSTAVSSSAWLSPSLALSEVRAGRWRDTRVEKVAWERIAGYPRSLREHQQRTTVWLPKEIGRALARKPELVQKAVETFYTRDPTQLRRAAKMPRFPPADAVLTQISMTRTAYAQLQGQEFWPSKAFGREWTDAMSAPKEDATRKVEREARTRGVKLAVGFEILCGESKARPKEFPSLDSSTESSSARLSALRQDDQFNKYMTNLRNAGWFPSGEIEGSKLWKEREEEAVRGWLAMGSGGKAELDHSTRPTFSTLFEAALSLPGPDSPSELAPSLTDDPEDWLDVDPAELEALMQERSTGGGGGMDVDPDDGQASEVQAGVKGLEALAKKVGAFVEGKGDLEGAVFDDELLSDDEDSDADAAKMDRDMMDSDDEDEDDVPARPSTISAEEKEARKARLVPALAASEWGIQSQKPPASEQFFPASSATPPTATFSSALLSASSTTPKATPLGSQAASALPVSDATIQAEALDRQQKLKALLDDQARSLPPVKMRRPLLPRDDFDGVDSDDESEEEEEGEGGGDREMAGPAEEKRQGTEELKSALRRDGEIGEEDGEGEEEEYLPQVEGRGMSMDQVGEGEDGMGDVDMGEEEEEFLKFAREALGLDEGMWAGILKEREGRGSFVPTPKPKKAPSSATAASGIKSASLSSQPPQPKPFASSSSTSNPTQSSDLLSDTKTPTARTKVRFSSDPNTDTPVPLPSPPVIPGPSSSSRTRKPPSEDAVPDPTLDSFEAVMRRMDEELQKLKGESTIPSGAASSSSATTASQSSTNKKNKKKKKKSSSGSKDKTAPTAATIAALVAKKAAANPNPLANFQPAPPSRSTALDGTSTSMDLDLDDPFPSSTSANLPTSHPNPFASPSARFGSDADSDPDEGEGSDDGDDDEDPLLAMDAELRAALLAAGDELGSDEEEDGVMAGDVDYGMIKNFLKSYEAQGGMAGPVGNLVGRLGKKKGNGGEQ